MQVAEVMKKYDLESVAVVNVQGQLVGRITIDDVVDVISRACLKQNRQLMSGITEDVEVEDESLLKNVRARLPYFSGYWYFWWNAQCKVYGFF